MHFSDFKGYIPEFLIYLKTEKNLAHNTYKAYASDLKLFTTFWSEHSTESSTPLLKQIATKYRTHLTKTKALKNTIARKLSCLNTFEKFIENKEGIKLNLGLVRPFIPTKQPQALSQKEIHHLLTNISPQELKTPNPHRDKAILELLYATGVRCSELIALKCSDINLETRSIMIQAPKKKSRSVFLSTQAAQQIKNYLECERAALHNPREFLFLNYRNQPLTTRSIQRICNMFSDFLKPRRTITPQLLRHSFATHMLNQGVDIQTVKRLLGFSSMASIEKYLK